MTMMWILVLAAVVILCIVCGNRSPKIDGIEGKFFPQPGLHGDSEDETVQKFYALIEEKYKKAVLQFSRNGTITYYSLEQDNLDDGVILGTYTVEKRKRSEKEKPLYWITCKWDIDKKNGSFFEVHDLEDGLCYTPETNTIFYITACGVTFTWTHS